MTAAARLQTVLAGDRVVRAPGCFDAVTAQLVEAAGFEVAYLSGAATSAVVLGQPDLGFLNATDMAAHAARVVAATSLPLVADADTGYGNAVHAARTVELYAAAGVAGLHIEDQAFPKRCGHMAGKAVVPAEEMAAKVRAAVGAASAAGGLVVIARTDAASVEGLGAAIDRAARYVDAGAGAVFVEGVVDLDGLARTQTRIGGVPLVVNASEAAGDRVDLPSDDDLAACGVRLVIHPVAALLAAARAAADVYASLAVSGSANGVAKLGWPELTDLLGLPAALDAEARYST